MPHSTAIITALITERPLCMACVTVRASLPIADVESILRTVQQGLCLRRTDRGRCRACGMEAEVFSVQQPTPYDSKEKTNDAHHE